MRKLLIGLVLSSLSFSGDVISTSSTNFNIGANIGFDTSSWTDWFDNQITSTLGGLENISTPIGNIPVGEILTNLWKGVSCLIPDFSGQVGQTFSVNIPTKITLHLPCQDYTIDFTPAFNKLVNKITDKVNGYIPDDFKLCMKNVLSPKCLKKGYSKLFQGFKNTQIEGKAVREVADKTNDEINEEVKKNVKAISQEILPIFNKENKETYNSAVLKAVAGAMKEAGSSTGKFVYPDKKQVQGMPEEVKTEYAYAVHKQMTREAVIQMFQNRIDSLFKELLALQQAIDSYCNSDIPAVQVRPPTMGVSASIKDLKKIAINRGHCPPYCTVSLCNSNTNRIINRINQAENHIVNTIREVGLQIRQTISEEQYRTRMQIHDEFMNYQANLKTMKCLMIKLEYQRNKIMIYNLMIKLAELETHYARLNIQERKKVLELINKKLKMLH